MVNVSCSVGTHRANDAFLGDLLASPWSVLCPLLHGHPLLRQSPASASLVWLSHDELFPFLGNPFLDPPPTATHDTDPATVSLVLLGVEESLDPIDGGDVITCARWAVDVGDLFDTEEHFRSWLELEVLSKDGVAFVEPRPAVFTLPPQEAAYFAQARSVLEWNAVHRFCSACGRATVSAEAGYKRVCPIAPPRLGDVSDDDEDDLADEGHPQCPTHATGPSAIRNISYPRTDPVVIACVVSADRRRILLGRKPSWPAGVYSCLAGFVEPGESIEEAVRREVREESSVLVGDIRYHSSQPWPFPNSLMIGCIAFAEREVVRIEDDELEDARWFTHDEVTFALRHGSHGLGSSSSTHVRTPSIVLRLPPETAIANTLIRAWAYDVDGRMGIGAPSSRPSSPLPKLVVVTDGLHGYGADGSSAMSAGAGVTSSRNRTVAELLIKHGHGNSPGGAKGGYVGGVSDAGEQADAEETVDEVPRMVPAGALGGMQAVVARRVSNASATHVSSGQRRQRKENDHGGSEADAEETLDEDSTAKGAKERGHSRRGAGTSKM